MTVREQFEKVTEPWGKEAIENTPEDELSEESFGLKSDLNSAFTWMDTPQGFDYWCNIYDSLTD